MVQQTKEEYLDQIKVLSTIPTMAAEVKRLTAEMEALYGAKPVTPVEGMVELGATADEFEKAGSKFAKEGQHLSEFQMPYWETPGVSMSFPFEIIAGDSKGITGKISAGISKQAVWKVKEILLALGVPYVTNKDTGKVMFNPAEIAGKKGFTVWNTKKDTRTEAEGGTGTTFTKAESVLKYE